MSPSKHVSKDWLDTLWRKKIYAKYKGRCVKCKGMRGLQAAHIFPRGKMSTRWDLSNGILLCSGPGTKSCHYNFDERMTALERRLFAVSVVGLEDYERLESIASKVWDKDWDRVRAGLK